MTARNSRGETSAILKWVVGILITALFALTGSWVGQRYSVEKDLSGRVAVAENNLARLLERTDANTKTLEKIYVELKEHRQTGK